MSTETAVLNEVLDPVGRCMNRDELQRLVEMRAPESVQARFDALAEKSSAGTLTGEERAEYETLVSAASFLAVLQSKARKLLRENHRD
jgi:hypothetical protein